MDPGSLSQTASEVVKSLKKRRTKPKKKEVEFGDPVLLIYSRGWIPCRSSKWVSWESEEDEGGGLHASRVGSRGPTRTACREEGELQGGRRLEFWMDEGSARISWRKVEVREG